jgi:hypothetical protein
LGIESLRNELGTHGYLEKLRFETFSDTIMISLLLKIGVLEAIEGESPLVNNNVDGRVAK